MTQPDQDQKTSEEQTQDIDFHGAALIDENGEEIPITEEMIQNACDKLDSSEEKD